MNKIKITKNQDRPKRFYSDGEFVGTGYWMAKIDFALPRIAITDKKLQELLEKRVPFHRDDDLRLQIGKNADKIPDCKRLWNDYAGKADDQLTLSPGEWLWEPRLGGEAFRVWDKGYEPVLIEVGKEPLLFNGTDSLTITQRVDVREVPVVVWEKDEPVALVTVGRLDMLERSFSTLKALFEKEKVAA